MTDDEIVTLLRRGEHLSRIVALGPAYRRVKRLQLTRAPDTARKQGRPPLLRLKVAKDGLVKLTGWACKWVEVSRETDANGNVVSMKVEVSE